MNACEERVAPRSRSIGGSNAAAALGQSRYKTMHQFFLELTGQIEADEVGADAAERIAFGVAMEPVIADMYAQRYRVKLRRPHQIARHRRYPWMTASYDRLIVGRREGLEIKNVDGLAHRLGEWGDEHSDAIPTEYLLQVHHYLAVSGYERWHLAACVGGCRLVVYHVERDPEMIEELVEGERHFWAFVERGEAPPLDYEHPSAIALLKRIYRGTDGTTIRLPAEAEAMHYARLDFEEQAKLMKAGADAARARLLQMMGNASIGVLPNGGSYRRALIERKAYEVEATRYIDFRFSRKGEPQ
ncbi:YqaJ viral recombinase family nuclease [Paraburkholderia adhaesiva]|uniref:YqaJ viral recombinase family nuclease n=1 Tax=Paraburkholderia adhaesiva TaxID=2883244 RepID=UPI001F43B82E|nr:YqaJ viral recombinase family protein [Paraburkholderia adhaesiva]